MIEEQKPERKNIELKLSKPVKKGHSKADARKDKNFQHLRKSNED
jgi:hypothetical protein